MTPEQWREIKPILQSALELESADRARYLEAIEPGLRAEVESLIISNEGHAGLLKDSPQELPTVAKATNVPRQYDDYRKMLADGPYDLVTVCTMAVHHAEDLPRLSWDLPGQAWDLPRQARGLQRQARGHQ